MPDDDDVIIIVQDNQVTISEDVNSVVITSDSTDTTVQINENIVVIQDNPAIQVVELSEIGPPGPPGPQGDPGALSIVGLNMPVEFVVSNSPLTNNGTIIVTKASGAGSMFWATPSSGPGFPIFRLQVPSDIPFIKGASGIQVTYDSNNITISASSLTGNLGTVTSVDLAVPAEFTLSGNPITTNGTITLTKQTQSANTFWAGPQAGTAAQPTFRQLTGNDLLVCLQASTGLVLTQSGNTLVITSTSVGGGGTVTNIVGASGIQAVTSGNTVTVSCSSLFNGPTTPVFPASSIVGVSEDGQSYTGYRLAAASGISITYSGNTITFGSSGGGSGNGSVTSVDLSMPSVFTVSGNPVTSAGTLTVNRATEPANTFWGGPLSGSPDKPWFRSIVAADLFNITSSGSIVVNTSGSSLVISAAGSALGVTSVGITMPPEFLVANSPVTTTGTFTITKSNELPNAFWAGPITAGVGASSVTEFLTGGATFKPLGLCLGPDNNFWFCDPTSAKIGRMTPAGVVTEFSPGANPQNICVGSDGNLWFTTNTTKVGKITTSGTATLYTTSGASNDICLGPDSNVWFTETTANNIGKCTPSGTVTEYSTSGSGNAGPVGICLGPDNNLWYTEPGIQKFAKITTSGTITEFVAPSASKMQYIVSGPNGHLWANGFQSSGTATQYLFEIDTTGTTLTTFSGATSAGNFWRHMIMGPDGNLWICDPQGNRILAFTGGLVSKYAFNIPTSSCVPFGICVGPPGNNNIWFSESSSNKIGEIFLETQPYFRYIVANDINPCIDGFNGVSVTVSGSTLNIQNDGTLVHSITDSQGYINYASPVAGAMTATWANESANKFLSGPINGAATTPTFRSLDTQDFPYLRGASGVDVVYNFAGNTITASCSGLFTTNDKPKFSADAIVGVSNNGNSYTGYQLVPGNNTSITYTSSSIIIGNQSAEVNLFSVGITEYSLGLAASTHVSNICQGSDGNYWFTTASSGLTQSNTYGKITPSGVVTLFDYPSGFFGLEIGISTGTGGSTSAAIISDTNSTYNIKTDGSLGTGSQTFGTTTGTTSFFKDSVAGSWYFHAVESTTYVASLNAFSDFETIDGLSGYTSQGCQQIPHSPQVAWFTETGLNQIGKITIPANVLTEYPLPTSNSKPSGICAGPDNNIWFCETAANQIGRSTLSGSITEFSIPTTGGAPLNICSGGDQALWFTEYSGNRIGRITPNGSCVDFLVPTASAGPYDICPGFDPTTVWFTERLSNKIGKVTVTPLIVGASGIQVGITGSTVTVSCSSLFSGPSTPCFPASSLVGVSSNGTSYVGYNLTSNDNSVGITYNSNNNTINLSASATGGGGGSGTVTSVGLADSTNTFNITNSPVTNSGTLTLGSFKNQSSQTLLGNPTSGSAAASFVTLAATQYYPTTQGNVGLSIVPNSTNFYVASPYGMSFDPCKRVACFQTINSNGALAPATYGAHAGADVGNGFSAPSTIGGYSMIGYTVASTSGSRASTDTLGFPFTRYELKPFFTAVVASPVSTNTRWWCGLFGISTTPYNSDTIPNNSVGFRYSTLAGDTTWQFITSDGSAATITDTHVSINTSGPTIFQIDMTDSTKIKGYINGTLVATNTNSGHLPTSTTDMGHYWGMTNLVSSANGPMRFSRIYIESY